jgi:osmoprotectant transport system ATP-binding protein
LIRFDEVSKEYSRGSFAVRSLSLEAPTGAITVLVGPSGCGKTTTLRMVNRLVEPTGGTILIDEVSVRDQPVTKLRRGIGYVIQHAGLFPHRTIEDNIATVPRLVGMDRRAARQRSHELMDLVGLEQSMARRYPHQLSGGQQQRVGVARALAADPPVLLMDEPFSAVDPIVRKSLQEQMLRIQGEIGKTILFVTHDVDEAIKLGDKIAVLREGGLIAQFGTPQELLGSPADEFVEEFLGLDRGFRQLTFHSSDSLVLRTGPIVTQGESIPAPRDDLPWVLIVDEDRRPVGWVSPAAPLDPLVPIGHTFRPGSDSLRAALDAAVLCEAGWAVGVGEDGRVVGVASQEDVAVAIRAARSARRPVLAEEPVA